MDDPVIDDVDFAPIDVLLEEVVRGTAAATSTPPASASARPRWLVAAALLLGLGAVVGAWWSRGQGRDDGQPVVTPAQDPQPVVPPPSTDPAQIRQRLATVTEAHGQALYIAGVHDSGRQAEVAAVAEASVQVPADAVSGLCTELAASLVEPAAEGGVPTMSLLLRSDAGDALELTIEQARGAIYVRSGAGRPPFVATAACAAMLRKLMQQADDHLEWSRGHVSSLEELRNQPADRRSLRCPVFAAEELRTELRRFADLQRLELAPQGLSQLPHGEIVEAIAACATLTALTLPADALTADDVSQLASMPALRDLTLVGRIPPAAMSALRAFGAHLQQLTLEMSGPDDGATTVRLVALTNAAPSLLGLRELRMRFDAPRRAPGLRLPAELIAAFPRLTRLHLTAPSIDATDLRPLSSLRLDLLALDDCAYVAGLDQLAAMPELRELSLFGSGVGDSDLEALATLRGLWALDLRNTKVTAAGLARLGQRLPDCTITAQPDVLIVREPGPIVLRKG